MPGTPIRHFEADMAKLDAIRECTASYDVGSPDAESPNNILSRKTVVYGSGRISPGCLSITQWTRMNLNCASGWRRKQSRLWWTCVSEWDQSRVIRFASSLLQQTLESQHRRRSTRTSLGSVLGALSFRQLPLLLSRWLNPALGGPKSCTTGQNREKNTLCRGER